MSCLRQYFNLYFLFLRFITINREKKEQTSDIKITISFSGEAFKCLPGTDLHDLVHPQTPPVFRFFFLPLFTVCHVSLSQCYVFP